MKSVGLKKNNGLYGNYANLWDLKNQWPIWELCKSAGFYVLSDENTEIRGKKSEKGDR